MVHELFAYLCVKDAAEAIAFYTRAFGAEETLRLVEPGTGRVGHAEVRLGGVTLMLSEEYPELGLQAPVTLGMTTASIHLHVDDCDAVIQRAVDAGATLDMAPRDQFYGERSGVVRDPSGHRWNVGHQIAPMTADEMQRRYDSSC
ncbi:MAG: VOC family protein [Acidobacteria bacterium]|nr:VOC family protein [Acidobacteriota bacterium]